MHEGRFSVSSIFFLLLNIQIHSTFQKLACSPNRSFSIFDRYKELNTCITPFLEVSSTKEVAGGELKKFPARLFSVPPRISEGLIPGVTKESYQGDKKLWRKHLNAYKKMNKLIGTTRYRNIIDMNAGFGGFAAELESPKSWVMNVVPTIAKNTLGVIYERGLIGIYHDWYVHLSSLWSSIEMNKY